MGYFNLYTVLLSDYYEYFKRNKFMKYRKMSI